LFTQLDVETEETEDVAIALDLPPIRAH